MCAVIYQALIEGMVWRQYYFGLIWQLAIY